MSKLALTGSLVLTLVSTTMLSADDVLDGHLAAVGGKAAMAKIKSIQRTATITGTSSYGALSGTVEEAYDLEDDRGYALMQFVGYRRAAGWAGGKGWIEEGESGRKEMDGDELVFSKLGASPSPLAAILLLEGEAAVRIEGEKEFNGKPCVVVDLPEGGLKFFVDPKTHLLEGVIASAEGMTQIYADYKPVSGMQFAGKLTTEIKSQNLAMVFHYTSTEVNGKIDETVFGEEPKSTPAESAKQQNPTAKQVIAYLDKDGDGKVSQDEASANEQVKQYFQLLDTNGDGALDLKEAEVMMKYAAASQPATAAPPSNRAPTAKQIVAEMDADGDGKISKAEASEDLKLYFGRFDANKDGVIDSKEASALAQYAGGGEPAKKKSEEPPGGVTAKQIVDSMDKNDDGKISKDEASEQLKPYFDQNDPNGDGFIDVKEAQVIADYVNSQ